MAKSKPVVVYNYKRGKNVFTTPNPEIAISRRDRDEIEVETLQDGNTVFSTLVIGEA